MASCDTSIESFQREDGELNVIAKYNELMVATLGEDSLYTRSKETMYAIFDKLNINDKEKAGLVAENIAQLSMQLSSTAMQTAVVWAEKELSLEYSLAQSKAETLNANATYEKIKEEICLLQKEDELKCIQIEATGAQSIRENGRVETYKLDETGAESCHPNTLEEEGLKYYQTRQVEADSYRIFAEAYRKSGVVGLGIDDRDQVYKGVTGTTHAAYGEAAGYTVQQSANAERQRIAYEDSKANHAANASSSMIGQMLSAEVAPADADVNRWRNAVDRLLNVHSSTPV